MDLLEPMVGPGRVRATVTADMDFTITEETHENYDPQKTAVRSEQTSNEQRRGGDGAEAFRARSATTRRHFRRTRDTGRRHAGKSGSRGRLAGGRREQRTQFERAAQHPQFRS